MEVNNSDEVFLKNLNLNKFLFVETEVTERIFIGVCGSAMG